jgi:hypothetical protein
VFRLAVVVYGSVLSSVWQWLCMGGYRVQIGSGCVWEGIGFRLAVVVYGRV